MKRLVLITMLIASTLVIGCSSVRKANLEQKNIRGESIATQSGKEPAVQVTSVTSDHSGGSATVEALSVPDNPTGQENGSNVFLPVEPRMSDADVAIQKVEFRPGVSSVTVEKIAIQYGCYGGAGAGLITDKGPTEVYRMNCDNGSTFLAKCELRQCQPMR